jgi:RNA polymerase sigma-70 factor (ECF subfamily)
VDERALIRSVQLTDDRAAFRVLVERYQGPLRRYLKRMTGGEEALADELAQETFLKAYRALPTFQGQAKFSTWIFQIARNQWIDHLRSRKVEDHGEPAAEDSFTRDLDLAVDLERAVLGLPLEEREILTLCYVEELTHSEVAGLLGQPLGTVKTRLLRAKERLIADYGGKRGGEVYA